MRKRSLILALSLSLAVSALAAGPMVAPIAPQVKKIQPKVNPKVLGLRKIPKAAMPKIENSAHAETDAEGNCRLRVISKRY